MIRTEYSEDSALTGISTEQTRKNMMKNHLLKKIISLPIAFILIIALTFGSFAATPATNVQSTSNGIAAPQISAPAGIVIDMRSGAILYAKDADTAYYPASITKVMTALLVMENCNLDDMVTFSKTATTNLESGAVTINLTEGDKLTVRQCMYALLLKSANEVANGLAEHVAGSIPAFAEMMNARAKQLGCTTTHFANPNGLNDPNHYTTAHDMALIARAAFSNETIRKIDTTESYSIPATKKNPNGVKVVRSNKIFNPSTECYYKYAIASKTGYTSRAGSTLVTAAEKDGSSLVTVILKSTKYLGQYEDTKTLMEYGFNFLKTSQSLISSGGPGTGASAAQNAAGVTNANGPGSAGDSSAGAPSAVSETAVLIGPGGQQN